MSASEFDAIVIGTGFGGAVAACRLVQAGFRVCVLERGRRYESSEPSDSEEPSSDFPQLPPSDRVAPDLARFRWGADQGLWDIRDLGDLHSVQAAGYGGGSLIYANVHLRAPAEVFRSGWPAGYGAEQLAKYYQLVAGMLDLLPATEAPFSLIKTDQLRKSAKALEREDEFFHPPLAVTFESRTNRFGQKQGGCRACGECDSGCRYRAKNTLDLNYLSVVDQSPNADVRTQAEALLVSELQTAGGSRSYEVTYRDHLGGREHVRIRAAAVFVCAGAVGSTELLLESKRVGRGDGRDDRGRGLPSIDRHDQLGQHYFLNADALGMVYDARLPNGALKNAMPRVLKPTVGPVITSAIVHRDEQSWFLLQDGGYAKAVARHVGALRAPALLRRNRYEHVEGEIPLVEGPRSGFLLRPLPPHPGEPGPLGEAGGIPGGPLLSAIDGALQLASPDVLKKTLPPGLLEALTELRKELDELRDRELEAVSQTIRDALAEQTARSWARALVLCLCKEPPAPLLALTRRIVRFLYERAAPSQRLRETGMLALKERYGLDDTQALARRVTGFLLGFTDDRAHSEHGMVLLAMGRDDTSGVIGRSERGELEVKLDLDQSKRVRVYSTQERLMRDVAATLGGKLRVNPFWAFGRKPVTVHSQGGCSMADDPKHGVTDGNGMVHGHPGLYVLDGASLPEPVGVNPSSTIAAIAERNIALYIAQAGGRAGFAEADYAHAAQWAARAERWLADPDAKVRLTPPSPSSRPPVSQPVGIRFKERMSGFHSPLSSDPGTDDDAYDAAELAGRPDRSVQLELTAEAADIADFMRDVNHRCAAQGQVIVSGLPRPLLARGRIELLVRGATASERAMGYHFELFESEEDIKSGKPVGQLTGYKRIRDDPGPDTWRDTTTLFIRLEVRGEVSYGAMHVAMNRFFFEQLPSFEVLGTKDPARVVWALTAFTAYFFGALQHVYLPQLDRVIDLLEEIELR